MNMLTKDIGIFGLAMLLGCCSALADTAAPDNILRIKPARCIALHQGQVCYQTLKIEWQADVEDSYCLYQQDNKTPLLCWDNMAAGRGSYEFEGASTRKFILVRKRDNKALAEVPVEVAWVYDSSSRRESHWRIF